MAQAEFPPPTSPGTSEPSAGEDAPNETFEALFTRLEEVTAHLEARAKSPSTAPSRSTRKA